MCFNKYTPFYMTKLSQFERKRHFDSNIQQFDILLTLKLSVTKINSFILLEFLNFAVSPGYHSNLQERSNKEELKNYKAKCPMMIFPLTKTN